MGARAEGRAGGHRTRRAQVRLALTRWEEEHGLENASLLPPLLNAVAIGVFNAAWRRVALKLNEWENHRLESQHRDAPYCMRVKIAFSGRLCRPTRGAMEAGEGAGVPL